MGLAACFAVVGCRKIDPDFFLDEGSASADGGTTTSSGDTSVTGTASAEVTTSSGDGSGEATTSGTEGSGDGGCIPQAEVCDGADNDCDGKIDEWSEDNVEL